MAGNTLRRLIRPTVGTAVTGAVGLTLIPAVQADTLAAIRLEAEFRSLKPDGRSTTVITAQVYDDRGNLVPDGTRIRFTTTAGRLDASSVTTRNGVARVLLTAGDQPGEAVVIAVLDTPGQAVPARISITFSRDADTAEQGSSYIRINGSQYIGYVPDPAIIQANGKNSGATFSFRAVTIAADLLQFHLRDNALVARGNVIVTVAGQTEAYDNLRFSFMTGQGVAEKVSETRIAAFSLSGPRLEPTPFETGRLIPPSSTYALTDISNAGITVVARSVLIEPNARIQFRRATFYVDGSKTFSAPLHVMNLGQDSIFPEQVVGYGAQGLTIDLPFYYQADPKGIGTLNIRRAARVSDSAYAVRNGWTFDLNQTYNGPNQQNGVIEVNGITRPDWGMRLRHSQRVGRNVNANAFVDFPNHRSIFATTQFVRNFSTFYVNATLAGSRSPGYYDFLAKRNTGAFGEFRQQLFAETTARPILGIRPLKYTLNTGVGQQTFYGGAAAGTVRTGSTGIRLQTDAFAVARDTTFLQSMSVGTAWVQGGQGLLGVARSGMTLQGTSTLNRNINRLGSVSLAYDYAQTPLATGVSAAAANGRHRASLNAFLGSGANWDLQLTGSQGLDTAQASLFGTLNLRIGGPWRGRVLWSESRFSGVSYREMEYALIRRISGRDFAIYYSTTSRRFQLDLSGARF